jgi:hypothetical protein
MQPLRESSIASWKTELVTASIRQGPSFIILIILIYGLGQAAHFVVTDGIPAHLAQIKAGYTEVQQAHDANLQRIIVAFEQEQGRYRSMIELLERLAASHNLLRDNHDLLLEVLAAIKRSPDQVPSPFSPTKEAAP